MGTSDKVRAYSRDMGDMETIDFEADESEPEAKEPESTPDTVVKDGWFSPQARFLARRPLLCFWIAFIGALALSVVGLYFGEFTLTADNAGWQTRGTLIANRHTQALLVRFNKNRLFNGGSDAWDDLIDNVQPGWETDNDDDDVRRRLEESSDENDELAPDSSFTHGAKFYGAQPFALRETTKRHLQDGLLTGALEGCDISWYTSGRMVKETHLWPVWKTKGDSTSALNPQVIRDLCVAEEATLAALQADGLCYGCDDGRCLPPYSLVFFARLTVQDTTFGMSCDELSAAFADRIDDVEEALHVCVANLKATYKEGNDLPESCPFGFSPTLVDASFGTNNNIIRYTSSIFASRNDTEALYDQVSEFDRAEWSSVVAGAYDTQDEDFVMYKLDDSLTNDMILAMASAAIVAVAILVHTRSPWITLVGLVQIILSFPLAYLVYSLIARLEFFPFLNFIGVFVVFALGADDVFVAVDKWKNARIEHKSATTEDIAAIALPDAAGAMFLTTVTTAVAFFATAICKVAPLKAFAIFCGLLVTFDYIMCVLLVFPALCVYDRSVMRSGKNCCISCHCCHRMEGQDGDADGEEAKPSLIRRILTIYYKVVHKLRWGLFLACIAGFVVSTIYALRLSMPTSADVRLLDSDFQFEKNYEWRLQLLSDILLKRGGSRGSVIWGVVPADTGHHLNPATWSQLVLDESFDPSSEAAQMYLAGFCDDLFANDFAAKTSDGYLCPMNAFDLWLQEESASGSPSDAYVSNCGSATKIPLPRENFDPCIIAWSQFVGEKNVLANGGKVRILLNRFQSRVRYDSPFDELINEWNTIESWMNDEVHEAPSGVNGMYFSSDDFWWMDTNQNMLNTAYGAAAIALAAAALVILFSSRSIMLTLFAVFTIGFILVSVTAMLVAAGWSLGFLESICFAIAIGISCDFVIHFAHACSTLDGDVSRSDRTQYALIRMGPSILAAAFTTICAAIVMMFTVITFFQKFAVVLFFTILMATAGSFIVFITLADCVGPNRPTYTVNLIARKISTCCCCCFCRKKSVDDSAGTNRHASKYLNELETAEFSSNEDSIREAFPYPSRRSDSRQVSRSSSSRPRGGDQIVFDGRRGSLYECAGVVTF